MLRGLDRFLGGAAILATADQAALVALQAGLQALGGAVECGIGIRRLALAVHLHAARDVDGDVGAEQVPLAREQHLGLDRAAEIPVDGWRQGRGDVTAQCVTHVDMLAAHRKLHGLVTDYVMRSVAVRYPEGGVTARPRTIVFGSCAVNRRRPIGAAWQD